MAKKIRKGNLKPQKVADGEKDFAAVLEIITTHRSRALMSVNVESLLTYWEIGAFLSPRIHSGSWSRAIVGKLAEYIKRNQPELRGYGKSNLYNMARVYDVFSSSGFLDLIQRHQGKLPSPQDIFQSATGKSDEEPLDDNIFQLATGKCLPPVLCLTTFTNLVLIASYCNDAQEQLFYIVYSYRERLKAKELEQSLAHDAYTSLLGGDKKNYSKKLKELYPTAPVVIKDLAFLDYLALPERHRESKLRREIVSHIRDFILEMGKDIRGIPRSAAEHRRGRMKVIITSFSYKRGLPEEKMAIGNIGTGNISTLATVTTFDCRAMPNPYWDESLRGAL